MLTAHLQRKLITLEAKQQEHPHSIMLLSEHNQGGRVSVGYGYIFFPVTFSEPVKTVMLTHYNASSSIQNTIYEVTSLDTDKSYIKASSGTPETMWLAFGH